MGKPKSIAHVILNVDGVILPPTGDGDFVKHTFPERITRYVDNGGKGTMVINPDETADAEVNVSPYSVTHKRLGALYEKQNALANLFEGFVYSYEDPQTGEFVNGVCYIGKPPESNAARDLADVTWGIGLTECTVRYGSAIVDGPVAS